MPLFRRVELPPGIRGRLLLHSLPGRYEPLEAFCAEMVREGVRRVVCLLPLPELREKSPDYDRLLAANAFPWLQHHLPIRDFESPDDPDAFWQLAQGIASALRAPETVLVHCAAGIGRTGTFATAVLLELGVPVAEAADAIERAGSRPETSMQREFLARRRSSAERA